MIASRLPIVTAIAPDVEPTSFMSPPYIATMECVPAASEDVENVAVPLDNVPVPSVADPSLKVTVPVADEGDTVAVKVTDAPKVGVALDADSDVVVACCCTFTVLAVDVDDILFVSPL